ncbi:hypothetical protein A3C89_02490 [Candidatus Kaiserbacteria bacterium RIFCSPHIGHO2_02_FULL_50_50]|uniref:Toxin-antitoxin system protein n=1 Tax=Candidatus Kaiserbacteria bacterium RIFCSPHIGHO2_02_FULL_50_50 TaxID=1798492 RepID=A0A1F6DD49_9BACT|nr:MAG: hypothetical protein A3C89_02490 [Candidatus Kaiserbacteria bacterium RIFCSPHIGHO2_02_FULL_50_50]OGG88187.1 MAG: hypothetical protein A3G62_00315 [Candidatus Kaiserbacteria bacterium RIFCSPLOWO2_12_FULL_50_10]
MKIFDIWNELKKLLDESTVPPSKFPKEGEVWMSSLGQNIGYEQNGSGQHFSRPLLVIKKFNNHMFWVVPLSTKQKDIDFYFNFTDPNGLHVSAILAQMRLVSVKRLERNMYEISMSILSDIKRKLQSFLK